MSIATEISRIQVSRNTIRTKLVALGLAQNTDTLDTLSSALDGIENRGSVSVTVREGDVYTIPKGYHSGSGTVSGVAGGGNYSLQSKSVTPSKSQQTIAPDSSYYGLSDVTVSAIPQKYQDVSPVNAKAADVLTGKTIVTTSGAVTGSMPNNGSITSKIDGLTKTSVTIPAGYTSGGTVSLSGDIEAALSAI